MAQYLVLIYGNEDLWERRSPDDLTRVERAHARAVAAADGTVLEGRELHAGSTASVLRGGVGGAVEVTDGPFLEAKEGLGGYYLLEAVDLDAALGFARMLPELAEDGGAVEVRPVVEPDR